MKAAVYCGTRNLYKNMITAAKSLLIHSDVDKIYFLIEDDQFPYELSSKIECINVSNQQYFDKNGPNYNSTWSYMILLRVAFTKIFPWLDTILSLDVDTIVDDDVSDLWNYDLSSYYFAAVREPERSTCGSLYTNIGVTLFNLKKMRDGIDDRLIYLLNHKFYSFPEQDVLNELCANKILELPCDYNISNYTDTTKAHSRKIMHFARIKKWQELPLVKKYEKGLVSQKSQFGLDIIIPAYKDYEGLARTLKSVYYPNLPWFQITVVDDCSPIDYSSLQTLFPTVKFLQLTENCGPGYARQYGIIHTGCPYFTFVDCGDIILSKYSLLEIKDQIVSNGIPYFYLWTWINGEWNTISGDNSPCTPGWVYKREFFELYNIQYCQDKNGSYSNEDIGFNHTCATVLKYISTYDFTQYKVFFETPIYKMIYDKDSLTHANNGEYMNTKQIRGLATNAAHCIKQCENIGVDIEIILEELNVLMVGLYKDFLRCLKSAPELMSEHWQTIRQFYLTIYQKYHNNPLNEIYMNIAMGQNAKTLLSLGKNVGIPINYNRFLRELEVEEVLPSRFLRK